MKAMYETQQEIKKVKLYEHSLEIILPPMSIKQVAMGYNFLVILTKEGKLFSMGLINACGQLGHGNTSAVYFPKLIAGIKEKVVSVQCG